MVETMFSSWQSTVITVIIRERKASFVPTESKTTTIAFMRREVVKSPEKLAIRQCFAKVTGSFDDKSALAFSLALSFAHTLPSPGFVSPQLAISPFVIPDVLCCPSILEASPSIVVSSYGAMSILEGDLANKHQPQGYNRDQCSRKITA